MAGVAALAAAGGLIASGDAPAVIQRAVEGVVGVDAPPPTCPLTGLRAPGGEVPRRPALAVKVENLPEARPQAGLAQADVVYEEPVEGGITRFIVVFHCRGAPRVGPVRSARTTDPDVLVPFRRPVLAYAGGARRVLRAVAASPLVSLSYTEAADAYWRDPDRTAPHDLYASTRRLWRAAGRRGGEPGPVFSFAEELTLPSRRARRVHLPFSSLADVVWTWNRPAGRWLRSHGDVPHTLEGGERVAATNVVVQVVRVTSGAVIDPAGNPSPEVRLVGRGRAYVFRDGRVVVGRWVRQDLAEPTRFLTSSGEEIPLAPGVTWVELLPSTVGVEVSR